MIRETPLQAGGMLPRLETPVASWRGIGCMGWKGPGGGGGGGGRGA